MSNDSWNIAHVSLADVSYPYHYGVNCVDRIVSALGEYSADTFFIVTDDTVLSLHGADLLNGLRARAEVVVLSLPAGEGMKSLAHLSAHLERAIDAGATRRSVVVTFGGGVPGNLGGLLAALLFRGIRLVHVPTTTVAAMDSVLSLKQAINSRRGKNHIGTYHAPVAVYVDVALLQTLPDRELRSGMCEAAKNALAMRPDSLQPFLRVLARGELASVDTLLWLLVESLAAKSAVTARDKREQHRGLILEYGHTIGHAIELCDQRRRGAEGISHGEAVALGMLAAGRIATALGMLDDGGMHAHTQVVEALGIPDRLPVGLEVAEIVDAVRMDNKRGYLPLAPDQVAMVLLRGLGAPAGPAERPLVALPMAMVEGVVAELADRAPVREVARAG